MSLMGITGRKADYLTIVNLCFEKITNHSSQLGISWQIFANLDIGERVGLTFSDLVTLIHSPRGFIKEMFPET